MKNFRYRYGLITLFYLLLISCSSDFTTYDFLTFPLGENIEIANQAMKKGNMKRDGKKGKVMFTYKGNFQGFKNVTIMLKADEDDNLDLVMIVKDDDYDRAFYNTAFSRTMDRFGSPAGSDGGSAQWTTEEYSISFMSAGDRTLFSINKR